MSLCLLADEPAAGPWHAERLIAVATDMMRLGHERCADRRPVVLAIDGRSSGGKTTLAGRLQHAVAGSAIVHTDDIAWWYSRFGWAELLINGVLIPARSGQPVSYRPPPWDERNRSGANRGTGGLPAADHRGRRCGAEGMRRPDRRGHLGSVRLTGNRAPQPRPRGTARRTANRARPPRLDGRRDPSTLASDLGNVPTSSPAVRRRFPSILPPSSSLHRQ